MAELLLSPNRNGHAAPPKLLGPDGKELASDTGIPLAHYANFAAIWNAFNQTYSYTYDEAIRASWENTLSMRRDVFIWGCLDERYRAAIQSPWHVDYPDEEDEGQRAVAGELEKLVLAIPRLTSMFRNLEDAVWYGRYGVQVATGMVDANGVPQTGITYHVPVNGDKIQVGWDGIPRVMISSTVQNDYEKKGWKVVTGMQSPMVILDRPELRERFLINQFERDDADYFEGEMGGMVGGVGVRSRIYWGWWMRQEMLGWAVNYMRKVGTLGLLVFPFAEGNPESEQAAQENIKQAGNRSSLMVPVPAGSDPKQVAPFVISPSNAGIDSLTSMIDAYWERHIERYIVGQNMSDGKDNDSGLGGSGRAEFAADSKYDKIKGDCDALAETLTIDLLKPLHRWNYAGQRFVYQFKFGVKDPQSADKLAAGIQLAGLVEIKADELREAGGFSKPQPGDEIAGSAISEEPTGFDEEGEPTGKSSKSGPWVGIKSETEDKQDGQENMQRVEEMHALQLEVAELRGYTVAQENYRGVAQPYTPQSITVNMPPAPSAGTFSVTMPEQPAPIVNVDVHVPEQPPPNVNVTNSVPIQPTPAVQMIVPAQHPPVITVTASTQEPPVVNINVPEPAEYEETSEIVRDDAGLIRKLLRKFKRK